MSKIILPFHVGQQAILRFRVIDSNGEQVVVPTVEDGDVKVKFTGGTELTNKHEASPGANEFRTDVEEGFIKITLASTDTIHHDFWVRLKDAAGGEWIGDQCDCRLLFKRSMWDGSYKRYYGYDDETVVAHQVASKIQVSNGDSPETFRDEVSTGSLIYGDVP